MKSDCVQPLLNALADGELNAWTAARVRRHVKACAGCRAEYEAIQALGNEARQWRSVAAPAGLQARLAGVLTQLPPSAEEIPMPTSTIPFAPSRRRPAVRWQPLAGAGALAAALLGAALLLPGSPGHPSIAFADVQRAMHSVKAISWVQTETRYDLQGRMTRQATQHIWVRRDPPAIAEQDSASSLPQIKNGEFAGPRRSLSDAHGEVNFHVQDGVYYLHPALPNIAREVQTMIDDLTASTAPGTRWKIEHATLNGRPALVFRSPIHWVIYAGASGKQTYDGDETFWADPNTLRVVRHRSDILCRTTRVAPDTGRTGVAAPSERIVQDAADFAYDVSAPGGVFNLAPPPGARVTQDDGKGNKTVVAPHAPKRGPTSK